MTKKKVSVHQKMEYSNNTSKKRYARSYIPMLHLRIVASTGSGSLVCEVAFLNPSNLEIPYEQAG